jgi:antitoxin (DNA-binding transcriptional repressor) of toxin-antitoxin stability system
MVRVTVSEARKAFSAILNKVAIAGERIVLRRGAKDVAAIVPIGDLQLLEQLEDAMYLDLVRKTLAETRETMSWELLDGPETMRKIRESIEGKKL